MTIKLKCEICRAVFIDDEMVKLSDLAVLYNDYSIDSQQRGEQPQGFKQWKRESLRWNPRWSERHVFVEQNNRRAQNG